MIGYAYEIESRKLLATIEGKSNEVIERAYAARFGDADDLGLTYTPAFGAASGLVDNSNAEHIEVLG